MFDKSTVRHDRDYIIHLLYKEHVSFRLAGQHAMKLNDLYLPLK